MFKITKKSAKKYLDASSLHHITGCCTLVFMQAMLMFIFEITPIYMLLEPRSTNDCDTSINKAWFKMMHVCLFLLRISLPIQRASVV